MTHSPRAQRTFQQFNCNAQIWHDGRSNSHTHTEQTARRTGERASGTCPLSQHAEIIINSGGMYSTVRHLRLISKLTNMRASLKSPDENVTKFSFYLLRKAGIVSEPSFGSNIKNTLICWVRSVVEVLTTFQEYLQPPSSRRCVMTKATTMSETSVNLYHTTWRYNPSWRPHLHLHLRRRENLTSYKVQSLYIQSQEDVR